MSSDLYQTHAEDFGSRLPFSFTFLVSGGTVTASAQVAMPENICPQGTLK